MASLVIGCLAAALLYVAVRWVTAKNENSALRNEIASLKRQLKRHRAA